MLMDRQSSLVVDVAFPPLPKLGHAGPKVDALKTVFGDKTSARCGGRNLRVPLVDFPKGIPSHALTEFGVE